VSFFQLNYGVDVEIGDKILFSVDTAIAEDFSFYRFLGAPFFRIVVD
jgi:hypothetical protein